MLSFSWLPEVEYLSSKMWPQCLASSMMFPTLGSCFTPLREIELPVPELVFLCWMGTYQPDGSILAYQNWPLPYLLEKGNLSRWDVEHLQHMNCPLSIWEGVSKPFLFCLKLSSAWLSPLSFYGLCQHEPLTEKKQREVCGDNLLKPYSFRICLKGN